MFRPHVAIVGGGIAGLAAAWFCARGGARVTVLEGSPRLGGKLRVGEIAGVPLDEGAEALLTRRPEALDLVAALGMGDELVHPGPVGSALLSRGGLRPMPAGQIMGVPADLGALAASQVLSPAGLARVPLDLVLPRTPRGADVSVAAFVGARLGAEVVDRLVEPLLGGVYAGRADELSFEATLPALATAGLAHRSLIAAARAVRESGPKEPGPVFATLPGGLGTLPGLLAGALGEDAEVRTDAMVRELRRTPDGWRLTIGPTRAPEALHADAVVLAVPAQPAARLLAGQVPAAARELAAIEYASMALITLAYPVSAFPEPPAVSGFLVPPIEGCEVKAVTFSSVKWPHVGERSGGLVLLRCSIGRFREEQALQCSDEELKAAAATGLGRTFGVRELPVDAKVSRWGGGLPQYAVGHLDRVARIRAAVAAEPGLAVAGAAYDGVGIPACIATARSAATRVLADLVSHSDVGQGESSHGRDGQTQGARP